MKLLGIVLRGVVTPPPHCAYQAMPLRRCEWRVWFREQTTYKPFIHSAPSYGLWNFSGNPKNTPYRWNFNGWKMNVCKMKGWLFIWLYEGIYVGFWRFPKFPMEFSRVLMCLYDGGGMTPFYEVMLEGKEVCMFSLSEPPGHLILAKPCLQLSTCNLLFVLKAFSKRDLCIFWWWVTHTTTLMRHSIVGAWTSMRMSFLPFHLS